MESSIRYLARHGRLSASHMSLPCLVIPGSDGSENASLHGLAVESILSDQLEFTFETAKTDGL